MKCTRGVAFNVAPNRYMFNTIIIIIIALKTAAQYSDRTPNVGLTLFSSPADAFWVGWTTVAILFLLLLVLIILWVAGPLAWLHVICVIFQRQTKDFPFNTVSLSPFSIRDLHLNWDLMHVQPESPSTPDGAKTLSWTQIFNYVGKPTYSLITNKPLATHGARFFLTGRGVGTLG